MTTPTCSVCNWSNTDCLNLGNTNETPVWRCHGCIKRERDQLRLSLELCLNALNGFLGDGEIEKEIAAARLAVGGAGELLTGKDQLPCTLSHPDQVVYQDILYGKVLFNCRKCLKQWVGDDPHGPQVEPSKL